jgi:hypothetical protein
MTHSVTRIHAFQQDIKQDNTFHQNLKENKHSNTWNQSFVAPSQMDHTLLVSNGDDVPKNDEENAVLQKIQLLYNLLREYLNTEQVKLVAYLNWEHYDTYNLYHDLKKHVLAFTVEQLSHDVLFQ